MAKFVAAAVLVLLASACGSGSDDEPILVMAAASLTDAFSEIEASFEAANPGVDVQLNLAGSSSLRAQILNGAPASVFASANEPVMAAVVDAGETTGQPQVFATNSLNLAVPVENVAGVDSVEDLTQTDLLVGVCAEGVPCGDHARRALDQLGVSASIDTNEPDVRALLIKLEAGELDVGIIYATDVLSSPDVTGIELPPEGDVQVSYPIVPLQASSNPDQAQAFVDFVLSPDGQAILAGHGFGAP